MATKILCDRCEKEAKPLVLDFGFTKWPLTPAAKQASGQIELHAIPRDLCWECVDELRRDATK